MTDKAVPASSAVTPAPAVASDSARPDAAGALLRAARQKQGLHIAALAAAIKVSPAKLEALEAGRYHELLDITFARALAQTVCRVLKTDPVPVLAQMPGAPPDALGRVDGGLRTPFRERPGRSAPADWAPWRHPVLWLVALLLLAAAAFVLVPSSVVRDAGLPGAEPAAVPVMPPAAAASDAGADAAPVAVDAASAAPGAAGVASAPLAAAGPLPTAGRADVVALRARQSTWVQVVDGSGQTLMARVVPAGETVELTASPPLRLRIGNAAGAELTFRGQPVDLRSAARDNIANITLP